MDHGPTQTKQLNIRGRSVKTLYVIAGSNQEYLNWRRRNPNPIGAVITQVGDSMQLLGLEHIEGVFIGTCYDRPDIRKIVDRINTSRMGTVKPYVHLDQIKHLTSKVTSWSQENIPTPQSFNPINDTIDFLFTDREEAMMFAFSYKTIAYEFS
jgi:hypothetical protein